MSKKPSVRICADCQHCAVKRTMLFIRTEYCQHPRAVDVVTGMPVWQSRQMRDVGSRLCGPTGRLWAAKVGNLCDQSTLRGPDPVDVLTLVRPIAAMVKEGRK